MRFKTDENLPAEVADLLADAGHDASSILGQDMGGTPMPTWRLCAGKSGEPYSPWT